MLFPNCETVIQSARFAVPLKLQLTILSTHSLAPSNSSHCSPSQRQAICSGIFYIIILSTICERAGEKDEARLALNDMDVTLMFVFSCNFINSVSRWTGIALEKCKLSTCGRPDADSYRQSVGRCTSRCAQRCTRYARRRTYDYMKDVEDVRVVSKTERA